MAELFEMDANEDISSRACDMSGNDLVQLILFFDSLGAIEKKKLDLQMRELARDAVERIMEPGDSEIDIVTKLSMLAFTLLCTITAHIDFIEMHMESMEIEDGFCNED